MGSGAWKRVINFPLLRGEVVSTGEDVWGSQHSKADGGTRECMQDSDSGEAQVLQRSYSQKASLAHLQELSRHPY